MRTSRLLLACCAALALQPQVSPQTGLAAVGGVGEWERVLPDRVLTYPADHGAHPSYQTEWWSLIGNASDARGRRFGFQLTVFRRGLDPRSSAPGSSALRARHVFAGHLALTDVEEGRTRFAERLRRGGTPLASASTTDLDLVLEDWSLRRTPDNRLLARAADRASGIELELELTPDKPLVLHGAGGYSPKGTAPGSASAYASWTRLTAKGRLVSGSVEAEVEGAAWLDHEHGSNVLEDTVVGWDWFGLQLDDGRDLMVFLLRGADGSLSPLSAGTLIERDGSTRALGAGDFVLEPQESWTSPRTGAVYPTRWSLSVPSAELRLEIVPLVRDAELQATRSTGVVYWEGPVSLSGSQGGRGYGELTGYAGSMASRF